MQLHTILIILGFAAVCVMAEEFLSGLWNVLVTRRIDNRRRADIALLQHLVQEASKAGINVVEKDEVR
jgi:hypothetical protein